MGGCVKKDTHFRRYSEQIYTLGNEIIVFQFDI